jgi:hypothetical protein
LANSNVRFELLARMYRNATTVQNGNTQVTVYANSVKFSVNVTGWPAFGASSNTLNYAVDISSKGGNSGATLKDKSNGQKSVVFSNGLMDMPTTATIDGVANRPITVTILSDNGNGNGNKQSVQFEFPAFNRSVVYDPVMCVGCTSGMDAALCAVHCVRCCTANEVTD